MDKRNDITLTNRLHFNILERIKILFGYEPEFKLTIYDKGESFVSFDVKCVSRPRRSLNDAVLTNADNSANPLSPITPTELEYLSGIELRARENIDRKKQKNS
jgi:hypothetical protein